MKLIAVFRSLRQPGPELPEPDAIHLFHPIAELIKGLRQSLTAESMKIPASPIGSKQACLSRSGRRLIPQPIYDPRQT